MEIDSERRQLMFLIPVHHQVVCRRPAIAFHTVANWLMKYFAVPQRFLDRAFGDPVLMSPMDRQLLCSITPASPPWATHCESASSLKYHCPGPHAYHTAPSRASYLNVIFRHKPLRSLFRQRPSHRRKTRDDAIRFQEKMLFLCVSVIPAICELVNAPA
jgi:hypothetical protein